MSRPGDDVSFDWRTSRRHGELTSLIEGFGGVLQSDGYEAYAAYERAHPEIAWVGCWAHARRKFIEAQGENPKAARVALKLIGRLYRLEREWYEADHVAGRGCARVTMSGRCAGCTRWRWFYANARGRSRAWASLAVT